MSQLSFQRRQPWLANTSPTSAFEVTSKRRKSYPSETHVKTGQQFVHGDIELIEKLGRNDPCPCGSRSRFQELLPEIRAL
ncbi:SEC-C domain-containing protein [Rhizobium cauense]|uniref:SEC-C metal-binding domain-containing protein n=1 Tax=Rhizobium cauense TaxID=1166683 RepID=UPI001C6EE70D|nr:SEC-C domain-containing protein [Rhizobium cauense]